MGAIGMGFGRAPIPAVGVGERGTGSMEPTPERERENAARTHVGSAGPRKLTKDPLLVPVLTRNQQR